MITFLVFSIIAAILGSIMAIVYGLVVMAALTLPGLTATWTIILVLVFLISLLQPISACVASGIGCSSVCGSKNTVVVMQQPMTMA